MNFATKDQKTQILVWLVWAIACLVFLVWPQQILNSDRFRLDLPALPGVITHDSGKSPLFPWHPGHRWRK